MYEYCTVYTWKLHRVIDHDRAYMGIPVLDLWWAAME